MRPDLRTFLVSLAALAAWGPWCEAAEGPAYTRTQDVIYGRKFGTALTMDVFTPKKANGAAVVLIVSGGFFSSHETISPAFMTEFLRRGYTVFAVVHASQPRFTVPEIIADMNRAVRFIRTHAGDYRVDPDRIGVTGASAGGHLSLMLGTAGSPGDPQAKDPVNRASSRVQAVACFFPPTDFLNYGRAGHALLGHRGHAPPFRAAFDYRELDPVTRLWVPILDEKTLRAITRDISPITHVTADDPPTLIVHGDKDPTVPFQQAEEILAKFKAAGVPAELIVRPGAGHGWAIPQMLQDVALFADWFDRYLKPGPRRGAKDEG